MHLLENYVYPPVIALDFRGAHFQMNPGDIWKMCVLLLNVLAAKDAEVELVTWNQILLR